MWCIVVGYVAPQATHFTGYCCWFMRGLGQHTLLGIVVGYMWSFGYHTLLGIIRSDMGRLHQWVQNKIFFLNSRKVEVTVSVYPPKLLKQISPHEQNHMAQVKKCFWPFWTFWKSYLSCFACFSFAYFDKMLLVIHGQTCLIYQRQCIVPLIVKSGSELSNCFMIRQMGSIICIIHVVCVEILASYQYWDHEIGIFLKRISWVIRMYVRKQSLNSLLLIETVRVCA
jgi:hypothetical protein